MKKLLLVILSFFMSYGLASAAGFGNCDPDSLQEITKDGIVMTQMIGNKTQYMLDENMDGTEDFILNFGPFWYEPDEGPALRPNNGDTVTIKGGLNITNPGPLDVIVVYEIDGEYWRNPYEPYWNNVNNNYSGNRQGGQGFAPGWIQTSVTETTITGKAILDTTFIHYKYYLDTNNDQTPDFFLNFGPFWYEPVNNIQLPESGNPIKIKGLLIQKNNLPCIIVLEIDDQVWRDTAGTGPQFVGKWIRKTMMHQNRILNIFDSACHISVPNNWHGGGMHDSFFVQMLQLRHQNMIQYQNQNGFMGFEIGLFNGNNQNQMKQNMWRMNFQNAVNYHLHYSQQLLNRYRKDESTVQLKRWNNQNQNWERVNGANFDTVNNIVTFSDNQVNGFYMLTGDEITAINNAIDPNNLNLEIYPNPAQSNINLQYFLNGNMEVSIQLVDILGHAVSSRTSYQQVSGIQTENISIENLEAGIYMVRLVTPQGIGIQKFVKK